MSESFSLKQSSLLNFISETTRVLQELRNAHVSERFTLQYPRSEASAGDDGSERRPMGRAGRRAARSMKILVLPDELLVHESNIDEASLRGILANLLSECLLYLDRIRVRVGDKSCKLLVTGDVNSGKSTFVNALLRKNLLPIDQQPCTQCFCEIAPGGRGPDLVVHAIADMHGYNAANSETYDVVGVSRMQELIQDEQTKYQLFKVMLNSEALLGVAAPPAQISIIDSPGLNSDLFKTSSLFSKQEDIDVVIFLINAANHMTLSARDFLERAGREKAYIFVVVNKFDDINNRDKCKRQVLAQIREVLPKTFEDDHSLVHFISAKRFLELRQVRRVGSAAVAGSPSEIPTSRILSPDGGGGMSDEDETWLKSFCSLERALIEFIYEKRTRSKLLPAQTFLTQLLSEIETILVSSERKLCQDLGRIQNELEIITPCFQSLQAHNGIFQADIAKAVEASCEEIVERSTTELSGFREHEVLIRQCPWDGLLHIHAFSMAVHSSTMAACRRTMQRLLSGTTAKVEATVAELTQIAKLHSRHVFASWEPQQPDPTGPLTAQDMSSALSFPEPLSALQLVDPMAFLRKSSALGALSMAVATFGYQPLVSTAFRMFGVSGRWMLISGFLLCGAFVVSTVVYDLEDIVRDRLALHYSDFVRSPEWTRKIPTLLQSRARAVLSSRQSQLVAKFETALQQQRQAYAERELYRTQYESSLEYFRGRASATRELVSAIATLRL